MKRQFLVLNKGFFQIGIVLAILSALIVVPSKVYSFQIKEEGFTIEFTNLESRVDVAGNENVAELGYTEYTGDYFNLGTTSFQYPGIPEDAFTEANSFSTGLPFDPVPPEDGLPTEPDSFGYNTSFDGVSIFNKDYLVDGVPAKIGEGSIFNGITTAWVFGDGTKMSSGIDKFDIKIEGFTTDNVPIDGLMTVEIFRNLNSDTNPSDRWRFWYDNYDPLNTDDPSDKDDASMHLVYQTFEIEELEVSFPGGDLMATFTQNSPLTMRFTEFVPSEGSNIQFVGAVPEPTTIVLLGIGVVGLVGCAVKQRFKKNKESN